MSHGEAQGGSPQHAGLTANFRHACRDESYIITTFYENALTPRKFFLVATTEPENDSPISMGVGSVSIAFAPRDSPAPPAL